MERSARVIGRYALHGEIASGGMATVYLGRLLGPVGFSRTVAIKRLHPQFAKDPEFVSMFLDEARLAARVRHPNVVSTLDVVAQDGELILVLEFVLGESLSRLLRAARTSGVTVPPAVAVGIATGLLYGLHAAHEATTEAGEPLQIVHRDVSPQNVLVGNDGIPRVLDFGIAKAVGRVHQTREGVLKGKVAYMPPEQLKGGAIDRRVDVYAASVVLWETLVGASLFEGENEWQIANRVMEGAVDPPSKHAPAASNALDAVVMRGLARKADDRFASAIDMAGALEKALVPASPREVAAWVASVAGRQIESRARQVADVESAREAIVALPPVTPEPFVPASRRETTSSTSAPRTRRIADLEDGPTQSLDGDPGRPSSSPAPVPDPITSSATSVAVAPVAPSEPASSRRGVLVGVIAAAALVVAFGLGALVSGNGRAVSSAPSASVASVDASPVPAVAPSATSTTSSPPPVEASPPPTAAMPTTKTHPTKATSTPPSSRKASCNPPYVIDDRGIKHLKPECL